MVIEARLYDGTESSYKSLKAWVGKDLEVWVGINNPIVSIPTLEGIMEVSPGDWIIQGVVGEFYPCKPDIFEKTYEEVQQCLFCKQYISDDSEGGDDVVDGAYICRACNQADVEDEDIVESGNITATPVGGSDRDMGRLPIDFADFFSRQPESRGSFQRLFEEMDQLFGTAAAKQTDNRGSSD